MKMSVLSVWVLFMGILLVPGVGASGDNRLFQGSITSSTYPSALPPGTAFSGSLEINYSALAVVMDFSGFYIVTFDGAILGGDFTVGETSWVIDPGSITVVGAQQSNSNFYFTIKIMPGADYTDTTFDGKTVFDAQAVVHLDEFDFISGTGLTFADYLSFLGGVLPDVTASEITITSLADGGGFFEAHGSIVAVPEPSVSALSLGAVGISLAVFVRRRRGCS